MYAVSETWKQKIYEEDTQHTLKIYINNVEVNQDYILGFNINQKLFSDDQIALGSTPFKSIELQLYKDAVTENISEIKVEYGILIDNEYELIPIGTFRLEKPQESSDDTITITAVDYMNKFEFNYDASEIVPATLKQILQDICNKAGVELGTTSFLNEDKVINVYDNTITARNYLSYISEMAGGFAIVGRNNKLYIRKFYQDEAEIDIEIFGDFNFTSELTISKVTFQDGLRDFTFGDDTNNKLWINPDNPYVIDEEQIENIYNDLVGFNTIGFEGPTIIDPRLDLGDCLNINGKKVLFQYDMDYIGRFKGTITSKVQSKEKEDTTVKSGDDPKIRKLQTQINQNTGTISMLAEQTDSNTSQIAEHQIQIDNITSTVESISNFEQNVSGKYQLILADALNTNILKFIVHAKTRISGHASNFNYAGTNVYATSSKTNITLVIDKQTRSNISIEANQYYFSVEKLNNIGEVSDKFVVEVNEETGLCEIKVLRYIKLINNAYSVLTDPDVELINSLDIKLFEGTNYVYIKEEQDWQLEASYMFNSELNKYYATKLELSSRIYQTAEEIGLEVRKKIDGNEIISKINQTAELIQIDANRISLIGKNIDLTSDSITINSNNFKVDEYGNMECNNAKLNGIFEQYDSNGYLAVRIINQMVRVYDHKNSGVYVGAVSSIYYSSDNVSGISFLTALGKRLVLGYTDDEQSSSVRSIMTFDTNNLNATPWIINTASGKMFPDHDVGVVVENGLIKAWNLGGSSGTVTIANVTFTLKNGLITNVTST